jgi:hypothetical protein
MQADRYCIGAPTPQTRTTDTLERKVYNVRLSDAEKEIVAYNARQSQMQVNDFIRTGFIHKLPRPSHLVGVNLAVKPKRERRTREQIEADRLADGALVASLGYQRLYAADLAPQKHNATNVQLS